MEQYRVFDMIQMESPNNIIEFHVVLDGKDDRGYNVIKDGQPVSHTKLGEYIHQSIRYYLDKYPSLKVGQTVQIKCVHTWTKVKRNAYHYFKHLPCPSCTEHQWIN